MILAIGFELVGTICAKASGGLTVGRPTWTMLVSYMLSVIFVAFALDDSMENGEHRGIDLGIAYATWSGLGTIVAAVAGVYLYGETLINAQYFGIFLTILGLIIINVAPRCAGNEDKSAAEIMLLTKAESDTSLGSSSYGSIDV